MARQLTAEQVEAKRAREQAVVGEMIALYCCGNHGSARGKLCSDCAELAAYAEKRTARCPFMATKTFCSQCKVHCYALEMREKIRQVMRYAGPRLMFSHPVMTIHHGIDTLGAKLRA